MKWIQATGDSDAVRVFQLKDDFSNFVFLRYYPSVRQIVLNYKGKEGIFSLGSSFFLTGQFTCRNAADGTTARLWIENREPGAGKIVIEKNIFTFRLAGHENNIFLLLYSAQGRLPLLKCDFGLSGKKKQEKSLFAVLLFGLSLYISDQLVQKATWPLQPVLSAV